jgi:hypothetical protein
MKTWKEVLTGLLIASVIIGGTYSYFAYGYGTLVVEIMDPPEHWGPASKVYIHYSAIMIHRADAGNESGWFTAVQSDGWIDLSEVLNVSKAIGQGSLQAGLYTLIRFNVTEAIIDVNGENKTATVESGMLNVPITRSGIQVKAGQTVYLVIDITPRVVGSEAQGFRVVPAARALPA